MIYLLIIANNFTYHTSVWCQATTCHRASADTPNISTPKRSLTGRWRTTSARSRKGNLSIC